MLLITECLITIPKPWIIFVSAVLLMIPKLESPLSEIHMLHSRLLKLTYDLSINDLHAIVCPLITPGYFCLLLGDIKRQMQNLFLKGLWGFALIQFLLTACKGIA